VAALAPGPDRRYSVGRPEPDGVPGRVRQEQTAPRGDRRLRRRHHEDAAASDGVGRRPLCDRSVPGWTPGSQLPTSNREVRRIANGTVVWVRATGSQAASDPRVVAAAPFDFIFVDGDHTFDGLQADWEAWAPRASDIIAFHDVIGDPDQGSVRFARERIFTDPRFAVLKTVGCLAVLKRR
jgi:hypothetical protein